MARRGTVKPRTAARDALYKMRKVMEDWSTVTWGWDHSEF
jgi:hypothetical protein